MKLIIVAVAVCGALAACGSAGATASVEMGASSCAVTSTAALAPGQVTFNVHNPTADELTFAVKEDGDTNVVGALLVHPNVTAPLTVTFDHGDEYVTHCGDTVGPTFKP